MFVAYAGAVARVAEWSARARPLVFVLRAGCIGAGAYWFALEGPLARTGFRGEALWLYDTVVAVVLVTALAYALTVRGVLDPDMGLLVEAEKLRARELDPDQRKRRHARRLELIGLDMARRGVTETPLEPARLGSGLAKLLFEDVTLKTDGWTRSADGHWTAPADEPGPAPPASS